MSRRTLGVLAAGLLTLAWPVSAHAAAPVCSPATGLKASVQAGEFIQLPQAPCSDADNDAIDIEITQAPIHGTLTPPGTAPIGTQRTYTADADAGGLADVVKFRAVAGGETSNEATLDIDITVNHAPVCPAQITLSVESGKPLVIAKNPCTDADGDPLSFAILDGPDHGALTATNPAGPFTYTPQAGYVGSDSVTYRAMDASAASNAGTLTINVTRPATTPGGGGSTAPPPVITPPPPPPPDTTPPTLAVRTPQATVGLARALQRGVPVTLTAGEGGRATIQLRLSKRDARRLGVDRRARRAVTVGRLSRTLTAGETKVSVKLTRKARQRLARVRRVKLKLVVRIVDAAGNARSVTRTVTLRRGG